MLHGKQEGSHLYFPSTASLNTLGEPVFRCYASFEEACLVQVCVALGYLSSNLDLGLHYKSLGRLDWICVSARGGLQNFTEDSPCLLIWEHVERY